MNLPIAEPFSIQSIAIIMLLTTSLSCYSDVSGIENAPFIEIFTTSQSSTNRNNIQRSSKDASWEYKRYEIDRISQLQSELSQGLPKDPDQAKQLVLTRFQSMNPTVSQQLENAGKGLAKAMRYGIDRIPAIVFDGQAVIYGVTDVDEATKRYRQWRERSGR